jgi:hypothetical protein
MHFEVAGEKDTSAPFCKWLVNGTTDRLVSIDLEIHDTKIDLDSMIGFFSNLHDREEVKKQGEIQNAGSPLSPFQKAKTSGRQKEPSCYGNMRSPMSCRWRHLVTESRRWFGSVRWFLTLLGERQIEVT